MPWSIEVGRSALREAVRSISESGRGAGSNWVPNMLFGFEEYIADWLSNSITMYSSVNGQTTVLR